MDVNEILRRHKLVAQARVNQANLVAQAHISAQDHSIQLDPDKQAQDHHSHLLKDKQTLQAETDWPAPRPSIFKLSLAGQYGDEKPTISISSSLTPSFHSKMDPVSTTEASNGKLAPKIESEGVPTAEAKNVRSQSEELLFTGRNPDTSESTALPQVLESAKLDLTEKHEPTCEELPSPESNQYEDNLSQLCQPQEILLKSHESAFKASQGEIPQAEQVKQEAPFAVPSRPDLRQDDLQVDSRTMGSGSKLAAETKIQPHQSISAMGTQPEPSVQPRARSSTELQTVASRGKHVKHVGSYGTRTAAGHFQTVSDQPLVLNLPSTDEQDIAGMMKFIGTVNPGGIIDTAAIWSEKILEYQSSPLYTHGVNAHLRNLATTMKLEVPADVCKQFGLLGLREQMACGKSDITDETANLDSTDQLIFANMDSPWSAFICGSQGAGKSHTLSCLLENALISNDGMGRLSNPMAGIVFHYDKFSSGSTTQVCESAYICSSGIPVNVLVSPSNIWEMRKPYGQLQKLPAHVPRPKVLPLYLTEKQLDIGRMQKLMSVTTGDPPLYMDMVTDVLRSMAMSGGKFSYDTFRNKLKAVEWLPGQIAPLMQRLSLLESFMAPSAITASTRPAAAKEDIWSFRPGTLTIVDLSDPFITEHDACALFTICLSIFLETRSQCGQIIALDEAHKFLSKTGEAKSLTDDLTMVIRQQRHTGTRVLIATQEPTLSPTLIDLANVTIVHRFLSPAWYEVLKDHLAGAKKQDGSASGTLFETIVKLETGQALLFSPTAILDTVHDPSGKLLRVEALGNNYAKIRVRKRITADGGRSVLASEKVEVDRSVTEPGVPMHIVSKPPQPLLQRPSGGFQQHARNAPPQPATSRAATTAPRAVVRVPAQQQPPPPATSLTPAMRAVISREAEEGYRKGWKSPGCVPWVRFLESIEQKLQVEKKFLSGDDERRQTCITTALDTINECRVRNGLKPINY